MEERQQHVHPGQLPAPPRHAADGAHLCPGHRHLPGVDPHAAARGLHLAQHAGPDGRAHHHRGYLDQRRRHGDGLPARLQRHAPDHPRGPGRRHQGRRRGRPGLHLHRPGARDEVLRLPPLQLRHRQLQHLARGLGDHQGTELLRGCHRGRRDNDQQLRAAVW